jgi:transposase
MRCTNKNCPYDTINRDKNAAKNIARAGFEIFYGNKRPSYLTKPKDPDKEEDNA